MKEYLDIHIRLPHYQCVADSNGIYFLQMFFRFCFIGDSNLCCSCLYHILLQSNRLKVEHTKLPCLDIPSLSCSLFSLYFLRNFVLQFLCVFVPLFLCVLQFLKSISFHPLLYHHLWSYSFLTPFSPFSLFSLFHPSIYPSHFSLTRVLILTSAPFRRRSFTNSKFPLPAARYNFVYPYYGEKKRKLNENIWLQLEEWNFF